MSRLKIMVIGAGFNGLTAARALSRAPVDVVTIDRDNYHLFQPLLYQVATAALGAANIASPIRSMFTGKSGVEVMLGEVDGIDPVSRLVSVKDIGRIAFDQLVIASGAESSWFGHEDWIEHASALKTLPDAEALRIRILGAFERAEVQRDPDEVRRLLTFVIVGGGASGVELAASIRVLARDTARDFRRIHPDQVRVMPFEGGPGLLAGFPDRLAEYARAQLAGLGVEVRTGVQVERIDSHGLVAGGKCIPSTNVLWCAGMAASPDAQWIGVVAGHRGTVPVGLDCSVTDHPEIFAIGDAASFQGPGGHPLPRVAPVAQQQGRYVARVIAARATGAPAPGPFRYRDWGSFAIVGRSAAIASLSHLKVTGVPAWRLWAGVHLVTLVGLRNRVMVYLQWVSAWLFHARAACLIVPDADSLRRGHRVHHETQLPNEVKA